MQCQKKIINSSSIHIHLGCNGDDEGDHLDGSDNNKDDEDEDDDHQHCADCAHDDDKTDCGNDDHNDDDPDA